MEKEKLFEVLNEWNYWNKEIPEYYSRKKYENNLSKYDLTDEITVVKGIRRCGKSTLLINHIKDLLKQGIESKNILFVNFEDPRLGIDLNTNIFEEILDVYKEYTNNSTEIYLFLDEIQNVSGWEKWVRTVYELKKVKKIYITGSSSKLLSREFGTALSGRYLDLNIYPASFLEFLEFNGEKNITKQKLVTEKIKYKKYFNQYLEIGGFPKVILTKEHFLRKKEILNYFETIILKDIVARYNLKNYDNIRKVAIYLISNISKITNVNKVRTSLNISYELIEKYFEYLRETYLVYEVHKYDDSLKKQYSSKKKIYVSDISFAKEIGFGFSENMGRIYENLVFLELIKRFEELSDTRTKQNGMSSIYYHNENQECDFIIKEGLKITQAIQVTKSLGNSDTRKRELLGLKDAMEKYKLKEGLILTEDETEECEFEGYKVIIKPIWKWLLEHANNK
ncbi:ATP-binding protein [Candidatus Woesearchaeota archaeon]|nr:ATP-binding protein [Nanoarchaeota archaeon]MCB9370543.1 ATP-binding protein [Candidatus Woesearchaeota archaeon]USN43618.1 MAG: ATP-binding protein [Candidatus Woesearchaeota archaeon]